MSFPGEVKQVQLPAEIIAKCHGFAMDIGGSVVKLIFRTKEDYEKAIKSKPEELMEVKLVACPRSDLDKAVDYIKTHAHITRGDQDLTTIYSTGVGCTQFAATLEATLQCQLTNISEYDCFVAAFHRLCACLPRSSLLQPRIHTVTREPTLQAAELMASYAKMAEAGLTKAKIHVDMAAIEEHVANREAEAQQPESNLPLAEAEDIYPCLLAMCGSSSSYMKIDKDGTFEIVDDSDRGGRTFYGLGCLMTGCKDFVELLDLASKGDYTKVHVCSNDMIESAPEEEADFYSSLAGEEQNYVVYSFGKAIGKNMGDFSREDLAATLLHFSVVEMVQVLELVAARHNCKAVYFVGSFTASEVMRKMITTEFARRNMYIYTVKGQGKGVGFEFVKPGSHLGAIGAFINAVDPFLPDV